MNILRWLLAIAIVVAGVGFGVFAWWLVRTHAAPLQPAALSYPVLLVEENHIIEICLNVDELTLRPENQDHIIEQRYRIVDASGARFRIQNYRLAEKRPSTLSRVFSATVYNILRFKVAFDLRRDGVVTRDAVMALLRDRDWKFPANAATAPLGELFAAYRADRFREYGQRRDQMPDEPAEPPKTP
jgi:hypothetical protein